MYTFITNRDSPNYTPASEAVATWGRPRTIEKIAIHWWDDPLNNPSFEGVINALCNPARQASAHFVATGTARRVACLVDPDDASWATASANPYTISIECDPRCRTEDYDVVGELIAELRATYGPLPLMRHSEVTATRCPGNYDLNRLNEIASTKIARKEDQYGMATTRVNTPPPEPVPAPVVTAPIGYRVYVDNQQVGAFSVAKNAYNKWVDTGRVGKITDTTGADVTISLVSRYEPPVPVPTPVPVPSAEDLLQNDRIGAIEAQTKSNTERLNKIRDFFKNL